MKKFIIVFALVILLGGSAYAFYRWQKYQKEDVPAAVEISAVNQSIKETETKDAQNEDGQNKNPQDDSQSGSQDTEKNQPNSSDNSENKSAETEVQETEKKLLPALNLKMKFYSQAPHSDWGYPWQEACEEASVLLIANAYFKHSWTVDQFNEEILKLVEWEKERFGAYEHTDMKQTVEILHNYLKLETKIHENPTYEDIQKILAKGHLIVMPLAGKQIKNPYYKNGGPVYHVLVVKGYKEGEKLITHDVGTRHGEDYVYPWKTLQAALHDYAEPINQGAKKIIEVIPPQTI